MSAAINRTHETVFLELLNGEKFSELDTALADVQHRFERGELREEALLSAFKAFSLDGISLGAPLQAWCDQHPGSYAAKVALATWLEARGYAERGGIPVTWSATAEGAA